MMRKCKKKEEITMKKSKKMASHFARSSFCFLYHSRRKITELKSPDCESLCNSCLPYH